MLNWLAHYFYPKIYAAAALLPSSRCLRLQASCRRGRVLQFCAVAKILVHASGPQTLLDQCCLHLRILHRLEECRHLGLRRTPVRVALCRARARVCAQAFALLVALVPLTLVLITARLLVVVQHLNVQPRLDVPTAALEVTRQTNTMAIVAAVPHARHGAARHVRTHAARLRVARRSLSERRARSATELRMAMDGTLARPSSSVRRTATGTHLGAAREAIPLRDEAIHRAVVHIARARLREDRALRAAELALPQHGALAFLLAASARLAARTPIAPCRHLARHGLVNALLRAGPARRPLAEDARW